MPLTETHYIYGTLTRAKIDFWVMTCAASNLVMQNSVWYRGELRYVLLEICFHFRLGAIWVLQVFNMVQYLKRSLYNFKQSCLCRYQTLFLIGKKSKISCLCYEDNMLHIFVARDQLIIVFKSCGNWQSQHSVWSNTWWGKDVVPMFARQGVQ